MTIVLPGGYSSMYICAPVSSLDVLGPPTVVTSRPCTIFMGTFPKEIVCGIEGISRLAVTVAPFNILDPRQLIRLTDGGTLWVNTFSLEATIFNTNTVDWTSRRILPNWQTTHL